MAGSVAGLIVILGLLVLGRTLGAPVVIGLFGSLAFGATAIVSLGEGGSSPLIYSMFLLMLFATTLRRSDVFGTLAEILQRHWSPWVIVLLAVYVVGGSLVLPRLLAGETTAFIPIRGSIEEMPLAPVPGNFTQTAYFSLGVLAFFAFSILGTERTFLTTVRRGMLVLVSMNVLLGALDLAGKVVGQPDLLSVIRTANYAMLTEVDVGGFWRISGGFSEASAFAAAGVACLGFAFTYWRATGSVLALCLLTAQLVLLVFSTSTTAYVSLALLSIPVAFSIVGGALGGGLKGRDLSIVAAAAVGVALVGFLVASDAPIVGQFTDLINSMVFQKYASASGVERAYWNARGVQAFIDSGGLGIGMGSSRSSSWAVSVLAQFGVLGSLMMGSLVLFLLRGMHGRDKDADPEAYVLAQGVRAAALGSLLTSSLAGSGADPGLLFFLALAIVSTCRDWVRSAEHGRADSMLLVSSA
jgi:hypothetical protein